LLFRALEIGWGGPLFDVDPEITDLLRGGGSGKFEKLLRSDPERNVWVVPGVSVV
jgi:hypothetical protein